MEDHECQVKVLPLKMLWIALQMVCGFISTVLVAGFNFLHGCSNHLGQASQMTFPLFFMLRLPQAQAGWLLIPLLSSCIQDHTRVITCHCNPSRKRWVTVSLTEPTLTQWELRMNIQNQAKGIGFTQVCRLNPPCLAFKFHNFWGGFPQSQSNHRQVTHHGGHWPKELPVDNMGRCWHYPKRDKSNGAWPMKTEVEMVDKAIKQWEFSTKIWKRILRQVVAMLFNRGVEVHISHLWKPDGDRTFTQSKHGSLKPLI